MISLRPACLHVLLIYNSYDIHVGNVIYIRRCPPLGPCSHRIWHILALCHPPSVRDVGLVFAIDSSYFRFGYRTVPDMSHALHESSEPHEKMSARTGRGVQCHVRGSTPHRRLDPSVPHVRTLWGRRKAPRYSRTRLPQPAYEQSVITRVLFASTLGSPFSPVYQHFPRSSRASKCSCRLPPIPLISYYPQRHLPLQLFTCLG